jgi:hypothetical protein
MKWTAAKLRYLAKHYPSRSNPSIAKHLGCTEAAVMNKALKIGVRKSPEYMSNREGGAATRFQSGIVPHNKGKKGWKAGGRSKDTQFKSGQNPHNTGKNYQVSLRADGYLYIRLSLNHWVLYHRWLYEKVMGVTLTPDEVLRFKDGNPLNVQIENLQLTDKVGHMLQNSVHNYPPEVVNLVRTIGVLKRTINGKSRKKQSSD